MDAVYDKVMLALAAGPASAVELDRATGIPMPNLWGPLEQLATVVAVRQRSGALGSFEKVYALAGGVQ